MWSIEYNGVRQSLEEWGLKNLQRRLISLDVDRAEFTIPRDFDAPDLFAAKSALKVFRDDVQWFFGRVEQTPHSAKGRYETDGYVVVGPWWYLQRLTYQMAWRIRKDLQDESAGYNEILKSRLILNMTTTGALASTRDQILSVLNYAIESGAPFSIGTIDLPAAFPLTDEVVNLTCEEVILRQLRWTPDAVGWFDYSQPLPALNIVQMSSRTTVTLPFGDGGPISDVEVRPRDDLQVEEVVLKYEITNVVNGIGYTSVVEDKAPADATGRAFNGLVQTFSLDGSQVSYSLSTIVCEPINADSADGDAAADWWKAEYAPLQDETVETISVHDVERQTALPRRLVSGSITGWMLSRNRATAVRETITAKADWDFAESEVVIHSKKDVPVTTTVIATNLESGTYLSSLSVELGEGVPTGLAAYLYNATRILHFDGQITLAEDECTGLVTPGSMVNISGAKPEYATMRAVVQSITESVDEGRTTVIVGPPKHLGCDDIIEFLRSGRNRQRITPIEAMTGGQSYSASPVDIGQQTPVQNSNADLGKLEKFTVADKIIIDRQDNPGDQANPGGKEIRIRELPYCDDSSGTPTLRKIRVLCSEIYD